MAKGGILGKRRIKVPNQSASFNSSTGEPIPVTYPTPPTPTGGTAPYTITYNIPETYLFPIGITQVSITATDANGRKGYGLLTITIINTYIPPDDPSPPTPPPPDPVIVSPPANQTVNSVGGVPVSISWSAAVVTGGTGPYTIVYKIGAVTITSPHTFAIGASVVSITATDSLGAIGTGSFTITIVYVAPPTPPPADYGGYRPQLFTLFGMNTIGGRGPTGVSRVVRVNSLLDTGAPLSGPAADGTYSGQLRAALTTTVPTYVVFDISGTIVLNSYIQRTNPYITIAGQTAPFPGIQIRGYGLGMDCAHAVIQHLRIRPGDAGDPSGSIPFESWTGAQMQVWDHCTASWGTDESAVCSGAVSNLTYWQCLVEEPLNESIRHPAEAGKFGLASEGAQNIAYIGCLSQSANDRNIYAKGLTRTFMSNCLISNPGGENTIYADPDTTGIILATLKSNWYRKGPSTTADTTCRFRYCAVGSQVFIGDNFNDGQGTYGAPYVINGDGINPSTGITVEPVTLPAFTPIAGNALMAWITPRVGARALERDSVSTRIIAEVLARGGAIISSQSEVGGWPAYAVNSSPFIMPNNPWGIADVYGRNNLEKVLEEYAQAVEYS